MILRPAPGAYQQVDQQDLRNELARQDELNHKKDRHLTLRKGTWLKIYDSAGVEYDVAMNTSGDLTVDDRPLAFDTGIIPVTEYGAITVGTNAAADDNAGVINEALLDVTSGGATVALPRGVIWSGAVTLQSNTMLRGTGRAGTTLKAKNSLNADFIIGQDTASLYSGTTSGGIAQYGLSRMSIDGNMANQSSGNGVKVYGRSGRLRHLAIRNVKERGLSSKWGAATAVTNLGVESVVSDVYVEVCGKEAIYWEGPNDSHWSDIFAVSAGQTTTNTYDAIVITGTYANLMATRVHSWRWSPGGFSMTYPRYAMRVETNGCAFSACEIEGGYTGSLYHDAQFCAYDAACQFYAVRTGGRTIILRDSYNILMGTMLGPESGTCYGLQMGQSGDTVVQNDIALMAIEQQLGVIDWTYDGGGNRVRMRGLNSAGTVKVGAATSTDVVGVIAGAGGGSI